jgi:hypothetical protein
MRDFLFQISMEMTNMVDYFVGTIKEAQDQKYCVGFGHDWYYLASAWWAFFYKRNFRSYSL